MDVEKGKTWALKNRYKTLSTSRKIFRPVEKNDDKEKFSHGICCWVLICSKFFSTQGNEIYIRKLFLPPRLSSFFTLLSVCGICYFHFLMWLLMISRDLNFLYFLSYGDEETVDFSNGLWTRFFIWISYSHDFIIRRFMEFLNLCCVAFLLLNFNNLHS